VAAADTSGCQSTRECLAPLLAAAHGARLRQAALDTAALVALLEFAPRDRVAMFEGLGIPLGQAVQLATALERNLRTGGAD
jgi:hypothetical protein